VSTKILPALSLALLVATAVPAQELNVPALPTEIPGPAVEGRTPR